jgi:phosphatidylserine/phosphatidylglycerophosphate/cardiolipin synthase-like enzyme
VDGEPAFRRICEAIASARTRVWGTVAFLEEDVQLPDGRGSIFDVLDAAAARGVDVRVIFWRSKEVSKKTHFPGTPDQLEWLAGRGSRFGARWDALPGEDCQHQKSWLIDAGSPDELAFVGGINLDHGSVAARGHAPREHGNVHDVYLEIGGPAVTDIHHNFVQRWNEASERAKNGGHWPPDNDRGDLLFPNTISARKGDVPVQIARTVQANRYRDSTSTPGGKAFAIEQGEFSIYEQYISAIDAARSSIYVEDQAIGSPKVVGHLKHALERGVEVIFLVPGMCHPTFAASRNVAKLAPFFELIESLDSHPSFSLAAIASAEPDGSAHEIYVHAKIMLVDDDWATIGSPNTADRSFKTDTELNASIWHPETVKALRCELFEEHLGIDTAQLSDVEAFHVFHERARDNAWRRLANAPMESLAYQLNASFYGLGTAMGGDDGT